MTLQTIQVERFNPAIGKFEEHSYSVPIKQGSTVLESLLYIYENYDHTLAFRYGCRGGKCGECAVLVNGSPRLACLTNSMSGMKISPLNNLPPVRDLIVDRSPLDKKIAKNRLYVMPGIKETLDVIHIPDMYTRLIGCLECYGCVSSCPHFDLQSDGFGGPYVFVRLAQLHLDPRDKEDRRAQAVLLGIERCADCSQCRCVKGIAIRRHAIGLLLGETTDRLEATERANS